MSEKLTLPPRRELDPEQRARLRAYLLHEFRVTLIDSVERPRRRRPLLAAIAIAVTAAVVAGAYGAYLLTRPADQTSIGCYAQVSLTAHIAVVSADGRAPTTICASSWTRLFPGQPKPARSVACVLASGAIGVFPAADACTTLGLARFAPSARARSQARQLELLQNALVNAFIGKCLDERAARSTARKLLDRHGYGDWQIGVPQPFTHDRPCASLAFDTPHQRLLLVGVPHA